MTDVLVSSKLRFVYECSKNLPGYNHLKAFNPQCILNT